MVIEVSSNNNKLNLTQQPLQEIKSQEIPTGLKHLIIKYKQSIQSVHISLNSLSANLQWYQQYVWTLVRIKSESQIS